MSEREIEKEKERKWMKKKMREGEDEKHSLFIILFLQM